MRCAESLRVQAYFDAEVDALCAADIERHLEHCPACRALFADLGEVRAALHRDFSYTSAPAALHANILSALEREAASGTGHRLARAARVRLARAARVRPARAAHLRPVWLGALGGAIAAAIAASAAFLLIVPRFVNPLLDELVDAHVRSLMPAHLIDVASTDKHTVKPWFAGHADVSPVVADFEPLGFRLIGGRADYLDHQHVAVVVYQHGAHIINVFSWAAKDRILPRDITKSGYHLAFWKAGDLEYCAVSDTGQDELLGLVRLLEDTGARAGRE